MSERYITWEPYAEDVGKVVGIFEGNLPPGVVNGAYTSVPDPVVQNYPGLEPVKLIKLSTKELYYNYVKPDTIDNRLDSITSGQVKQQESIMNLYEILIGGAV